MTVDGVTDTRIDFSSPSLKYGTHNINVKIQGLGYASYESNSVQLRINLRIESIDSLTGMLSKLVA